LWIGSSFDVRELSGILPGLVKQLGIFDLGGYEKWDRKEVSLQRRGPDDGATCKAYNALSTASETDLGARGIATTFSSYTSSFGSVRASGNGTKMNQQLGNAQPMDYKSSIPNTTIFIISITYLSY
jgi:hypothetical protein